MLPQFLLQHRLGFGHAPLLGIVRQGVRKEGDDDQGELGL